MLLLENWNRERQNENRGCPCPLIWIGASFRVVALPCRRRQCAVCGVSYRRFVQARLFKGLEGTGAVKLLIVTWPGGVKSPERIASFNEDSPRRLKALLRRLRRECGEGWGFFWTAELTKAGVVHFNVLVRDLPFLRLDALRTIVVAAGFGPGFTINRVRRAGVRGIDPDALGKSGAYITKAVAYVSKGSPEWMSRRNLYGFSRNWAPDFVDQRRAVLMIGEGPVAGHPLKRQVLSGTRRQLVAAGFGEALPPAGRMFLCEADGFSGWRAGRSEAAHELTGTLGALAALLASPEAPRGLTGHSG